MVSSWARASSDLSVAGAIPALEGTCIGTHSKGAADDEEGRSIKKTVPLVTASEH